MILDLTAKESGLLAQAVSTSMLASFWTDKERGELRLLLKKVANFQDESEVPPPPIPGDGTPYKKGN